MSKAAQTPSIATPGGLSPAELQLFRKIGEQGNKFREDCTPGVHEIDLMCRLEAVLTVGEDQTTTKSNQPTALEALAIVFEQLGPKTANKVLNALVEPHDEKDISPESTRLAKEAVEAMTVKETKERFGNVSAGPITVTRMPGPGRRYQAAAELAPK